MLHDVTTDQDDKHAKYRRWLCWRGSRLFVSVIPRTLLLFLLPIIASLFQAYSTSQDNNNLTISNHSLILWYIISSIGWVLERLRVRMIRKKIIQRIPFIILLLFVVGLQLMEYSLTSYIYPLLNITIMDNKSETLTQVQIPTQQRRIRGQMHDRQKKQSNSIEMTLGKNIENGEKEEEVTVARISVMPEDFKDYVAIDTKTMEKMTFQEIVHAHEQYCATGFVSVILAAHNEHEYMTRTLNSLLNSTSAGLLKEILIIDDGSHPPLTTSYNTSLFKSPLIKVHRNEEREGLIRSKNIGGNMAEGRIIVFLDAHVKPDPGWVFPIVRHINTNYKRVVVPSIPVLNGTTWEVNRNAVGEKMMFDWELSFHWFNNDDDWVPCMSGGLLAISKKWWHESGELDTGMFVWGGENIEQSIRIWLCGGEIVVAHDSIIAHVFRPKFPYPVNSTKVLYNKLRTVEVWFDEFKDLYYNSTGAMAPALRPKVRLPHSGQGIDVDPDVDGSGPFINISKRIELRERLQCKPFSWYIKQFEEVFKDRNMLAVETFLIRNPGSNRCLRPIKDSPSGEIGLVPCDEEDYRQRWNFRYNNTSIQNLRQTVCLDATIGKMPQEWKFSHLNYSPMSSKNLKPLKHYFEIFSCSKKNINQTGWKLESNRITFGSFCVEADEISEANPLETSIPKVFLTSCTALNLSEYGVNTTQAWIPPPNQYFQLHARKIMQPTESQAARSKK